MLELRNVNVTIRKTNRQIIKDFNLVINKGDKIALIGEEGNGKSTLLKFMYDTDLIEDYTDFSGQIVSNNLKIGYLEQFISTTHLNDTIQNFIFYCEDDSFFDVGKMSAILSRLKLNPELIYCDRLVSTLSGGEKIKLQLAKILYSDPEILLLDEPTNDLDLTTLEWLEKFINDYDNPIMYISHDELLLERTANVIVHFEQLMRKTEFKYTVAKSNYRSYVENRLSAFARQEQVANNERSEYQKKFDKWNQIYQRVDHEQATITRADPHGGKMLKRRMKTVKHQEKLLDKMKDNFTDIPDPEEAINFFFDSKVSIASGKTILNFRIDELKIDDLFLSKNIEIRVVGPEKIVIIGDNGVGKTTLLRQIYENLKDRNDMRVRYMPQNYKEVLDYDLTPIEFLAEDSSKEKVTRARMFLGNMKFTSEEMMNKINELSGGQKAKLLLLKLIIDDANVLILDEPTRNVSPLSNPIIREVLKDFKGTIISISHDRKYIMEVTTKIYSLTKEGLMPVYNIDL